MFLIAESRPVDPEKVRESCPFCITRSVLVPGKITTSDGLDAVEAWAEAPWVSMKVPTEAGLSTAMKLATWLVSFVARL